MDLVEPWRSECKPAVNRPSRWTRSDIIIGSMTLGLLAIAMPVLADEVPGPWHFGAYVDLSRSDNPGHENATAWRGRGTSSHVNEFGANVGVLQIRKGASTETPWGLEFALQGGWDTEGQLPVEAPGRDRRIDGADTLRHIARANVSYLVPNGDGLLFTAGLMNSFIGYESFYAKDNFNYTRSYLAEYSPYFLIGAGARVPFSTGLTGSVYLVNGYNYLSHPNDLPSLAGQLAWQIDSRWTLTQNVYIGSDQARTDIAYWRFFSDSILQWRGDDITVALAYDVGTERMAERSDGVQSLWMGSAVFAQWRASRHWNFAVRPEVYWDPDGRLTGARQLIEAITLTSEYVLSRESSTARVRLEYRYDNASGREGGFYTTAVDASGNAPLTHTQHLFLVALLLSFDI